MPQQFDCSTFLVLYGCKIHALVTHKYTTIKIMQEKNDNFITQERGVQI